MGEINQEIAALRQEVAALRSALEATDDWASSVFVALELVLPFLLRGHPQVEKVRDLLHSQAKSFEELQAHPHLQGQLRGKTGHHEAGKMLYDQLALLGVWPGVQPQEVARRTLERTRGPAPAHQ